MIEEIRRARRAYARERMRYHNSTPPQPRPSKHVRRARNAERRRLAAERGHHVIRWLGFRPSDFGSHGPAFYRALGGTPYKDLGLYHAPEPRNPNDAGAVR